jgi:putative zinc finger/helix-turn-helix YgiT family protein
MKCRECREAELNISHENYRYDESGLPDVTLVGVEIRRCPNCGFQMVAIPRMEELHRKLAQAVATHVARLSGPEIRFLRKYLGYSQKDFAGIMGVEPETASNWERDVKPIGPTADRLLRMFVMRSKPVEEYPNDEMANVAQPDAATPKLRLRPERGGWAEEATAV